LCSFHPTPSKAHFRFNSDQKSVLSGIGARLPMSAIGVPCGIGPIHKSPASFMAPGKNQLIGARKAVAQPGRYPRGTLIQLGSVVRSIDPTPLLPSTLSALRRSGYSI
jgi:hypothetical protein